MSLRHFRATAIRHELAGGTTRPYVCECQPATDVPEVDADPEEFVVKLRAEVRDCGLLHEYVAARLAQRLGIPMPEPVLVTIGPELAAALAEEGSDDEARRVGRNVGLNFGTRFLTPGYTTWILDAPVPDRMQRQAAEIMAFDALIDNADRRRSKPNLLARGDDVYVIDHEMAFAFIRLIGGNPLALDLHFLTDHPFFAGLRGRQIEMQDFEQALASITGAEADEICESAPQDFGVTGLEGIRKRIRRYTEDPGSLVHAVKEVLRG